MKRPLAVLFTGWISALMFCQSANATLQIGTDFIFSGLNFRDNSLRSHNYLFVGSQSFAFGPMVFFEIPDPGVFDVLGGAGMRFGSKNFVEFDGGYFIRKFNAAFGRGLGGAVIIGHEFNSTFRISVPIVFKSIQSGDLTSRLIVEYIPYLGLRINL